MVSHQVSALQRARSARTPDAGTFPPPVPPRKRPQSVGVDGSSWVRKTPAIHAHTLPHLAEMVLPKPLVAGSRWTLLTCVLGDFLLILANFVAISHVYGAVHHHLDWLRRAPDVPPFRLGYALLYGSLITLLAFSEGTYRNDLQRDRRSDTLALLRTVVWATLLSATLVHLLGIKVVIPLGAVLATAVSNFVCMVVWREWQRRWAARRTQNGRAARNVLIVGAGRVGREIGDYMEQNPQLGRVMRGYLDDDGSLGSDVLGTADDLARIARAEFADEVILAAPLESNLARTIIREARRIHLDVKLVPELFGLEPRSPCPEMLGGLPVVSLHEEPLPLAGLFFKRGFDVVCSSLALVFSAPALLFIGVLICLDSPGPVLYRALRVGRKGRCFLCYKFRTMVANADAAKETLRARNQREGPFFKIASDPRITRIGGVLRRYSLDELPQLWNVLRGEMSMVGPRPHPLDDFARYDLDHLRRLDVKPGLTGLWQVSARQDPSFTRGLTLDRQYIEQWSLGMDLRILFRTFSAVLRGSGS